MMPARKSQLHYYRDIPLYINAGDDRYTLYKPAGMTLKEMRIQEDLLPRELFLQEEDRLAGLQEAQKGFNQTLNSYIEAEEPLKIRETLKTIVEETFQEPRSGSLEGMAQTVNILIGDLSRERRIVEALKSLSSNDYGTAVHSINVMAFVLGFASYTGLPTEVRRELGLCALLHDVGKTKIPQEIIQAPRKLTEEEFSLVKQHPLIGFNILEGCKFPYRTIGVAALEHHEKLDGSGYPRAVPTISEQAKIIGIIDCYEALTSSERLYRTAMAPLETLKLLKNDVDAGKFSYGLFEKFAYTLVGDRP
ncbi:MAG: HD domain-containing protein [Deltaproteobacteria bacterium]|nr:HD domain-containing protein [Deltaproteobacteria bacterium]